ncbi:hypothetical protein BD289DRAFT_57841 [Coniella lustricola]|uniref:Uncharacterized protein n=1 Tax=Coniella lustricola TaxID=2025994 RepID=A0A2T3AIC0_9PEZI|nr:hypothetical protein BD289DRAFT_57841 [Coniella lustricola]
MEGYNSRRLYCSCDVVEAHFPEQDRQAANHHHHHHHHQKKIFAVNRVIDCSRDVQSASAAKLHRVTLPSQTRGKSIRIVCSPPRIYGPRDGKGATIAVAGTESLQIKITCIKMICGQKLLHRKTEPRLSIEKHRRHFILNLENRSPGCRKSWINFRFFPAETPAARSRGTLESPNRAS